MIMARTLGPRGSGSERPSSPAEPDTDPKMSNSRTKDPVHRLAFVLLPHFNAMATVAAIDPFRAANYLSARKLYDWTVLSLHGEPVQASSGVTVAVDAAIDARPSPDILFVCSSWTPEAYRDRRFFGWLRALARSGVTVGGIDTGAIVLAHAGLLNGYRATAHYEH